MILLKIEKRVSTNISLVWLTMSKVLARSIIVMDDVRSGGLKHWSILCSRERRVDTVKWLGQKVYWLGDRGS